MATRLLLVHSPLAGRETWDLVAAELAGRGYPVAVPDPDPGQTWLATVPPELAAHVRELADGQGWLPPWPQWWGDEVMAELIPDPDMRRRFAAGCPRLPLAMFSEVHPPAPGWPAAPGAYLQLSDAYADEAARARDLGWPVTEQPSDHLAMLTKPGLIAGSLLGLLGLTGPLGG